MKHRVHIVIPKAFDLICVWIVSYKKESPNKYVMKSLNLTAFRATVPFPYTFLLNISLVRGVKADRQGVVVTGVGW